MPVISNLCSLCADTCLSWQCYSFGCAYVANRAYCKEHNAAIPDCWHVRPGRSAPLHALLQQVHALRLGYAPAGHP